ncbi:MAG: phosphoribosylamine--glycine ligase [Chthonomonadales bacterium]|nr:phosphoribosylamine--glycine ligase [Chthonomonadales bacterium]
MRILVVGGGGREHALIWKIAQSPRAERIYCAPGNAGIKRIAECINLKPTDLEGLANFAANQRIDLTVVGPEAPLIAGIVDRFEARGLPIFGPATDPARLEGSKAFAKEIMAKYGIPTAEYRAFDRAEEAHTYLRAHFAAHPEPGFRIVVKADGLAAGKGVVVASSESEAHEAIERMMVHRVFGQAGDRVVVEEHLEGEEVSIMAFTDGEAVVAMPPSQDHKRVFDNDSGPNTGGMGAYSPVPTLPHGLAAEAVETVLKPAIAAIRDLGIPYKGVLYAGLMLTDHGLKTLEFNCRFGDPETQAVLPLLQSDLLELMHTTVNCCLEDVTVQWKREAAVCVVAASGGYPDEYATGKLIEGLDRAAQSEGCLVFHAGTREQNGQLLTDGGRVLGVTGLGEDLAQAASRAYAGMKQIAFDGIHYRHDIAWRALAR